MSREFSAVKAGLGMFVAAPLAGALCPAINAATCGGTLDGVLPGGVSNKLCEGISGLAAGAQSRVHGLLASLRGSGIGADIESGGEENLSGGMFAGGLAMPSLGGLGGIEQSLSRVAGMARRGLEGGF